MDDAAPNAGGPGRGGAHALAQVTAFTLDRKAETFPASALDAAATMLLDTLGVAAGAASLDAARIGRDMATMLFAASREEYAARLLFDGRTASLAGATFAAATQIDNFDAHDGYNPTKGHIGVVAAPALAALSEHGPDMSGPEALATLIVGYEVAGRAGIALHATASDYHTSGAWNALGVAAMAARRRGMTPAMLREALGAAEYHGPRSQMMREIANPTMLHDGSGWGGLVGVAAAIGAEKGFEGAPAITVEAPEVAHFWGDLGAFWQIERQYVKPYPICRWAHAAIDAVWALRQEHGLSGDAVNRVSVNTFHQAAQLFPGMPDSTSKAQYSLAFAVATMLVKGRIGSEEITGAGLADPAVARMVERIEVSEDARHSDRFPEGRWSDVSIELSDGRVLRSGDVHARGGPERPFDRAAVMEKYLSFAAPVLGEARAQAIAERTYALTSGSARFSELAELLYAPPGG